MLASRRRPPGGTGKCAITQHLDRETGLYSLTIGHADPVILIADVLLRLLCEQRGEFPALERNATLELDPHRIPGEDPLLGAVLRITGTNQTVVYRISRRHDEHTYIGEWPD